MKTKLFNESDILNEDFRKKIIDEITKDQENQSRKGESLRRHEIYRDKNSKWVMSAIEKEGFKPTTVAQMRNRASNISVCRKIINKLASTYVGGVQREAEEKSDQESLDALVKTLEVNRKMKKSDRYRQLQKNTMIQIVPVLDSAESTPEGKKFNVLIKNLAPWEYDVIEDPYDKTKPRCVVLTDFTERDRSRALSSIAGSQGIRFTNEADEQDGDGRDQLIADSPADSGRGLLGDDKDREFIFWTANYHVTCTADGKIVPGTGEPDNSNPISILPFVNITDDQDGQFWAQGGEDVVEGSILINKKFTDINFVLFFQGWGQLVIAARNVPKKLDGGPDNAFIFEKEENEGEVQVFFASSSPPVEQWLNTVKTFLAMLLTSNNLSVRNVSANLDVQNAASGVALLIEGSEVINENKDVQTLYGDKEVEFFEILRRWHTLYSERGALIKALQEIKPMKNSKVKTKFLSLKPPISEKEELEVLRARKDLGIATLKDLVKRDNPDLSDADIDKKLEELRAEGKAAVEAFVGDAAKKATEEGLKPDNQGDQNEETGSQRASEPPISVGDQQGDAQD